MMGCLYGKTGSVFCTVWVSGLINSLEKILVNAKTKGKKRKEKK